MSLDNRAWLVWGLAVTIPAIASRNPWILIELLAIVATTRRIAGGADAVRWIVRLAMILVTVTIVFNVLTVHSGDTVLAVIPENVPVIGGNLTLNALVYGVVSAVAILTIVLTWLTVSSQIEWIALMRQLPDRVAPIAAAGSIAWAWLPAMRITLRDIRESQQSRGTDRFGARQLPALIVPLLAGGLERAMTTTDVLDARGFGSGIPHRISSNGALLIVLGVTGSTAAAYLAVTGQALVAGAVMTTSAGAGLFGVRTLPAPPSRTCWRPSPWSRIDSIVTVASVLATSVLLFRATANANTLVFSPYPTLAVPYADGVAMLALLLLFAPAFMASRR